MRTKLRSKVTLLFIVCAVLIAVPVVAATADQLRDELVANNAAQNIATITQNDPNGFVNTYHLDATGAGANVDGQCDVNNTNPVTFSIDTPAGVTATPNTLTFKQCGTATTNTQDVTFTSDTANTTGYVITATQTSSTPSPAIATGNATFTLKVNPDTTKPTVTAVSPTGQSEPRTADVTATFSEAMKATTINGTTFTLTKPDGPDADTNPDPVAGVVNYDSATKKATLNPDNDLDYSTTYTATVTTGAQDLAGNALDQDSGTAGDQPKIWSFKTEPSPDNTAPVITPDVSGTLGNNGWYTSDVSLTWSVVDNESAISSQSGCDDVSVTTDQNAVTYTCTATSAGGESSETVSIKRDTTAPTINDDGTTQTPNGALWFKTAVTNDFSASDATSNLADSGKADFSQSSGTTQGNAVKINSGPVSDNAGNTNAGIDSAAFKIDLTKPVVSVTGVTNGDTYTLGSVPTAGCNTTDALSGVKTHASLSVTGGPVGSVTAKCDGAVDNADNTNSASVTYNVNYNFSGFFSPVDNPTSTSFNWNSAKSGQSIPVKFGLSGNQGLSVLNGAPKVTSVTCPSTSTALDAIEEYATTTNNGLVYDSTANQYNYVWKTQSSYAGKCIKFDMVLMDNTHHEAYFKFLK